MLDWHYDNKEFPIQNQDDSSIIIFIKYYSEYDLNFIPGRLLYCSPCLKNTINNNKYSYGKNLYCYDHGIKLTKRQIYEDALRWVTVNIKNDKERAKLERKIYNDYIKYKRKEGLV